MIGPMISKIMQVAVTVSTYSHLRELLHDRDGKTNCHTGLGENAYSKIFSDIGRSLTNQSITDRCTRAR
jgi:hypothetical protein